MIEPDGLAYKRDLAVLLEEQGRYDEAERFYRRAVELSPNNSNALSRLARFLAEFHGQYDEARQMYERAIAIDPTNAKAISELAALAKQTDKGKV